MPLYVKDPEVSRLAETVALISKTSKTEALRRALRRELAHVESETSLTERIMAFTEALHKRAPTGRGQPVDKAWVDSLYE